MRADGKLQFGRRMPDGQVYNSHNNLDTMISDVQEHGGELVAREVGPWLLYKGAGYFPPVEKRAPDNVTLGGMWNHDGSRNEDYPEPGPIKRNLFPTAPQDQAEAERGARLVEDVLVKRGYTRPNIRAIIQEQLSDYFPVATPNDTNPIEEGVLISSGWKYIIEDLFDAREIISFSDWDVSNPEERAWEFYKSYPRDARMYKVRIVKYERELVAQPARLADSEPDREVQDDNG